MLRMFCAMLLLLFLASCATTLSSGTQSINSVELNVSRSDNKSYYLVDSSRKHVSSAVASSGKLVFELPRQANRFVDECVTIVDSTGKPVLDDKKSLFLASRSAYQNNSKEREQLVAAQHEDQRRERMAHDQLKAANARLRSNRAYVHATCTRPVQTAMPARPQMRCATREECLQDGAAICFSKYLGAKGCGLALNEFNIPGMLSSPVCAATAAKLAGEKYELGEALVDALYGVADDAARELMSRGTIGEKIVGAIIGITSESLQLRDAHSCTQSFVERQFAPLENWNREVSRIRAEPAHLLQSCQQDVQSLASMPQQISATAERLRQRQPRLQALESNMNKLMRERSPIQWCRS